MDGNKEFVKKELLNSIDEYYRSYKLPEYRIDDEEIDAMIDVFYNHFNENGKSILYMDAIKIVLRRALNYSMVNEADYFGLYHIIKSLNDLMSFDITEKEIEIIQNEIMMKSLENKTKKNDAKQK